MITEWFLNWAMGVVTWLVDLLPDWDWPAELAQPGGMLESILANAAGVGIWIDWAAIIALALIPLGVWVIGLTWKGLRTAFSHFAFIGGSG
ncbi:MAG: hypothetical protein Q7T59_06220 [Candidatus Woesebacteria bacterium]|nr:hypothetical protein [Candidatus Woesebacteria bacterium]